MHFASRIVQMNTATLPSCCIICPLSDLGAEHAEGKGRLVASKKTKEGGGNTAEVVFGYQCFNRAEG